MTSSAALRALPPVSARHADGDRAADAPLTANFAAFYDAHVAFVYRGARRLGVPPSSVEDVVQDVFLVVHRRLAEFRHESSVQTWLYGILLRVARLHRRTSARADLNGVVDRDAWMVAEQVPDARSRSPEAAAEVTDAWRTLLGILDQLDEERREIFVLAELEQMPVPEIAKLLGIKLNTAYSRLRLARVAFECALERNGERP